MTMEEPRNDLPCLALNRAGAFTLPFDQSPKSWQRPERKLTTIPVLGLVASAPADVDPALSRIKG